MSQPGDRVRPSALSTPLAVRGRAGERATHSGSGAFDRSPFTLFLCYSGVDADPGFSQSSIGVALSSDGTHFTKYSGKSIMASCTRCPTVVYDPVQGQLRARYNGGMYEVGFACPGNLAARKEVSVFIIAGMGESGSGARFNQYFDDIANYTYAPFINRMKELGITSGCAVRRFCPDSPATRREVAVFVISAMGERPSLAPFNAYFDDIANDGFAPSINRIFELRITAGCATRRYCPSTAVDRASMAVFDAEAFLW